MWEKNVLAIENKIFEITFIQTVNCQYNSWDRIIFYSYENTKGQLISKKIVKPRILPKNEQMNSFLLVCDVFSFIFWENPRPEKNVSRFIDL